MNFAAVYHRSTPDMCYSPDGSEVVVNIRTGREVDAVYLVHEDPFIHELNRRREWYGRREKMTLSRELAYQVVYTLRVRPEYKRLMYYFELEADGKTYCLFENKLCEKSAANDTSKQFFKYGWLNPSDIISPPSWVGDTVWYQIMPDRFCRHKDARYNEKFRVWGDLSNPNWYDCYGGTLKGITERLDYLHGLGISGIYMTPIFESNSSHKYNTFDYTKIDPDFGTEDDLRELVREAHRRGIRVMLDAVFNHCGHKFAPLLDVCEKGRDSKCFDWFFINSDDFMKDDFTTADGRFYSFSFWAPMPKLNTNNPEVVKYFSDLCCYWAKEWDIDGIRFDVGDEVSHSFIRRLRENVKAVKPDIYLLGEIWVDSLNWLCGDEYDAVMNYPFSGCVNDFWKNTKLSSRDFVYAMNACHALYPEQGGKELGQVFADYVADPDKEKRDKANKDDKETKKLTEKISTLTSGLSSIAGGLKSMGINLPAEVDQVIGVIQGVTSVIEGVNAIISIFSTTSMSANTAALIANTAALNANTVTNFLPFANGGVVHAAGGTVVGNTYSGDQIPAMLNAGEVVLNRAQTGNLASQLEGGVGAMQLSAIITGEQLRLVLNNNGRRTGRGEYVTTNFR